MFKKIGGVLAAVAPVASFAAVPAGAEAIFTGLATDFGTISGYAFTAMGIITGGIIVYGLVKRMAKKSAS